MNHLCIIKIHFIELIGVRMLKQETYSRWPYRDHATELMGVCLSLIHLDHFLKTRLKIEVFAFGLGTMIQSQE